MNKSDCQFIKEVRAWHRQEFKRQEKFGIAGERSMTSYELRCYKHIPLLLSIIDAQDQKLEIAIKALKWHCNELNPFAKGSGNWPIGIHEVAHEALQRLRDEDL